MAKLSDYLKTRKHDEELFNNLLSKVDFIETGLRNKYGNINVSITIQNSTQLPYIMIESDYVEAIDSIKGSKEESELINAIKEVGFEYLHSSIRFGNYQIHFSDVKVTKENKKKSQ